MDRQCAFCGAVGRLTAEHVFGDWLNKIGFDPSPRRASAGPLNRLRRDLGVSVGFKQKVRDVCAECNHGWMSRLEESTRLVLAPLVLGEDIGVSREYSACIAAWVQKTALVSMLVSSAEERASGYGLPVSEYRALYERQKVPEPLSESQVWIGRCSGEHGRSAIGVVPLVVATDDMPEPAWPHAYATTVILGQLVLHAVRFTTPSLVLKVSMEGGLVQLWPEGPGSVYRTRATVEDDVLRAVCDARQFRLPEPGLALRPWKTASELEPSRLVGSMIELPTMCGKHVVNYPAVLAREALHGRYCEFAIACNCDIAYLIRTKADGAHCKASGPPENIMERYEALAGTEYLITDANGQFFYKSFAPVE